MKIKLIIIILILSSGLCFAICEQYHNQDDCPYLSKNFNWEDVEKEAAIYYYANKNWHKIIAESGKAYIMMGECYPSIYPNSKNYVELYSDNGITTLWTFYKED